MSAPLDDIDSRLLAALLSDGRASATELADVAGIATSTATKRLTSLEDDSVIEGYQPEVDYAAFGYDVTAVFRLDIEGSGLAGVVEDLAATDRMVDVYEVTGSDDVVAIGRFTDTDELNAQIRELVTDEHVRTVTTNIVLDTVREYEHPPVVPSNERS
ncbi:AsnC family transcriptional regulator [Halobacteriales archaeon QH_10_67_22]|nr:MAG: AsnC family transcriptional regulator [Halobacteriales archaeon QH_10_67_22]